MLLTTPPPGQRPPAYTEVDPLPESGQRPSELPTNEVHSIHHTSFGPTPLMTQPLIPYAYYDARSPYSMAQADARARSRLISASLCTFGLWIAIGLVVGVTTTEYDLTRTGAMLLGIPSSVTTG